MSDGAPHVLAERALEAATGPCVVLVESSDRGQPALGRKHVDHQRFEQRPDRHRHRDP